MRALQPSRRLVEVLDLKAKVMDAAVVGSVGADVGGFFGLPVQDRQINVTIGQKYRSVWGAADLLHAEGLLVERGGLPGILCRQRDVLDSGHGFLPPGSKA